MEKEKRQMLCDELRGLKLTPSLREEFNNIAKNQPVFAGNLLSHQGADDLYKLGLVFRYEGEYVLTDKGTVLKDNLKAAFDIMCNGVLYTPKGCKLEKDFKELGCGKCGSGSTELCDGKKV